MIFMLFNNPLYSSLKLLLYAKAIPVFYFGGNFNKQKAASIFLLTIKQHDVTGYVFL